MSETTTVLMASTLLALVFGGVYIMRSEDTDEDEIEYQNNETKVSCCTIL